MDRTTSEPLPVTARKALVDRVARTATGKARRGLELVDFREPTQQERDIAAKLEPRARQLIRPRRQAA